MKKKYCSTCCTTKDEDEFYRHKRDGRRSMCISCSKASRKESAPYFKEYRRRPEVRAKQRLYTKKLRDSGYWKTAKERKRSSDNQKKLRKDPVQKLKHDARRYTNKMKRRGKTQQLPCAECGRFESQAHHEDYNRPLHIVWLCLECHTNLHNELKRQNEGKPAKEGE